MKVRVKLMTINNVPASALGDDPEKVIKRHGTPRQQFSHFKAQTIYTSKR